VYLNGCSAEMLPLEHAGIVSSPRPRPCLPESGLAGGVVAVRLDALEAVDGADGAQVLVPRGSARPRPGDLVAWCTVTAVAPAVLDAEGRVAADGWLPDHVRLGVLEQYLGEGTIEAVVAASQTRELAADEDDPPKRRQRIMSLPLVARLVLLMTLLPNASYVEAMTQLVGVLPRLPWVRGWQVPSSKVITSWRRMLGVDVMRELFTRVAGPIVATTDPGAVWRGLRVRALDGFQVKVAESPENRAAFGSSGTADDSSPFPLVRVVVATARAGRAILEAVLDASWVGELTLADRLLAQRPDLFTNADVYALDRQFGGFDFLDKLHRRGRGAHFVVRMKANVNLPVVERLGPGEYLSYLRSRDGRCIKVRVVEYDIRLPDGTISELFCLATTLLDPTTHPAEEIADVYAQRWSASETTIGENKAAITDAGPSRGPNLRPETPDLVRQEIWAWLAATQLVRIAAHAATQTTTGVSTDQISFTTTRREATRSMAQSLVTATTSPDALADAATRATRGILSSLVTTDRDRHSPREQKWRAKFPHTATTKPTTRGPLKPSFGVTLPDTS
jgi:Insertion element 4 transposase N-terminal/Transposase DDE domain